ncbi:peptidoglycan-binding domain-containing protein [Plastoroseomonas hellenica]|uniref:Peptidoglycan-binding protein n=1 Tax=Plastoroseomonas hellenica TaxID=2687306 RepID=A0ABS5ETF4_9PROT|nr:peptidoglycan-binding domain-containing protein [Plastoroseomonas hellenica]MBR0642568.1 peptidoglycan-binding protein [Plastoroseomonas hellenica]MBR0663533.1 peptidoglycan-binding protein [Plastoroseomonas hellenica]
MMTTLVRTAVLSLALAAPLALPAAAQQAPASGLSYVQPLAPPALARLQERLRQAGDYTGRADGAWSPESQEALERFQQRNGLQATGQLNQATAMMLGINTAELLSAGPAADQAPRPLSILAVQKIQAQLRVFGFYRGGIDGIWGPGTQAAIERFQLGRGLQPTGQLNPETAQALGLDLNNLDAPPG